MAFHVPHQNSALLMESQALLSGLQLAEKLNHEHAIFESDCITLVNILDFRSRIPTMVYD